MTAASPSPSAPVQAASTTDSPPALRHIDWIWRVRGEIAVPDDQSERTAIDRLVPLFQATGTSFDHSDDTLFFTKKDPAAQDKLAVFNAGTLHIARSDGGRVLRYDLTSRALLACFLAPLLFLAFGQLAIAAGYHQKAVAQAEKAEMARKKKDKKDKKDDAKELPRNPIDVALGAPPPKTKKEMKAEKEEKEKEPPSATPAYVFASIFALLYLIGRILEPRIVRTLFTRQLETATDRP